MSKRKIVSLYVLVILSFTKVYCQTVNYFFKLNHGGEIKISSCRTLNVKFITTDSIISFTKPLSEIKTKDSSCVFEILDSLVSINFFETRGNRMSFSRNLPIVLVEKCNPESIEIGLFDTTTIEGLIIKDCKINKVSIRHSYINGPFQIFQTDEPPLKIDSIEITNSKLTKRVRLGLIEIPKYLQLENIEFASPNTELDLTNIANSNGNSVCNLVISGLYNDMSRLRLNYEYFHLIFNSQETNAQKENIYYQLLETQRNLGYSSGYGKLDRECKEFEYIKKGDWVGKTFNFISKTWWNYGYNKQRVIKWSLLLFFAFFIFNWIYLYPLFIKIYCPDKFKRFEEKLILNVPQPHRTNARLFVKRFPIVFVYTAYLFWGLKLDIKEIEIRKGGCFILLFFEYLTGLVCMAYLANYIFTR